MTTPTVWAEPIRQPEAELRIAHAFQLHPITARLLINRGLTTVQDVNDFFEPDLSQLSDPSLLPGIDTAVELIVHAIQNHERIFLHGDYDVDGVTSTTLYVRALRALGADVVYKIPHRQHDGYDLKIKGVEEAVAAQARLLLTTDCGIRAQQAVEFAIDNGLTVVITDHHLPGKEVPKAHAIVNPHLQGSQYPQKDICGCAVAFKVMQAVIRVLAPEEEEVYVRSFLDLVACGTVADVMPLLGENRVFVVHGLYALANTRKVGLRMLLEATGVNLHEPLGADVIGYTIGPNLNAVGRMGDAQTAADLLLCDDVWKAKDLVKTIMDANKRRKEVQARIMKEAVDHAIKTDPADQVLVVASKGWSHGVIGIIAGKLSEMFGKPTCVIGIDDANRRGVGSARSVPGFSIVEALETAKDSLDNYGGHAGAAGFSLPMLEIGHVRAALNAYQPGELVEGEPTPTIRTLRTDGMLDINEITPALLEEFALLGPFGEGNPDPVFYTPEATVFDTKIMGSDKSHLKVIIYAKGGFRDCMSWGNAHLASKFRASSKFSMLYKPQINVWNGQKKVQFLLEDHQTGG